MALVVADRVKETTTSTGTGTLSLAGAVAGFQSFVAGVGNTNTTYYAISDSATGDWEVGIGTVTSGTPDTLSRDTVLESSNTDNLVNFGAGQKIVICTQPAEKAVYLNAAGDLDVAGNIDMGTNTITDTKVGQWDTAYGWGDHGAEGYLTGNQTITLSGDVSGSGTTSIIVTVADDSHNHVISNIDSLQTTLDSKVPLAGGTMTGFLTLNADPTNALHAATKEYVDTIASASLHYHDPVRVESPVNLPATYNNGTAGVGATLTNSGTQAALVIDGVTLSLNDRVLIYQQTDATQNGVYTVTNVGSGSTNWVLTRATDADSSAPSDPDALGQGDAFYVKEGDTGAGELYVMNTEGTITFGTTNITFAQISSAQIYSAGSGLDLTGVVFSHADTSSQASVNNSNGTVIQDITLDTFGHITAIGSADLDGRYYTETEVGNFFSGSTAITGYNKTNWDTAYGWGNHASAGYQSAATALTTSTSFGGDVSGTYNAIVVADDSHNHIISNVDGLQTALDAKQNASTALTTSTTFGGDVSGTYNAIVVADDSHTHDTRYYTETEIGSFFGGGTAITGYNKTNWDTAYGWGNHASAGYLTGNQTITLSGDVTGSGTTSINVTITKDPVITLSGAVTGSATMTNLGSVTITTTATSDPTLTLTGDVTGSATFTNLGNATLNATVADDSHNHSNYAASDHNHTYNVNNAWLRDNGDDANVKLYGNSRQMAFRTDGTTEYASGVGGYPFAWMYGGDTSSNRIMLLNTSGDMWTSSNGWLSTALASKATSSHTHSYLPLSGGTITGDITASGGAKFIGDATNALALAGLDVHAGRNNQANRVVRTDANGYIQAGWINTTSGDQGGTVPTKVYASNDDYIRYYDLASFRSFMNVTAKTGYQGREQNTADTNYWVGTMGWSTTTFDDLFKYGSGSIDTWSSPSDQPSTETTHWVGSQHLHYHNGSTSAYGHQIVVGAGNPSYMYVRGRWGTSWGSWFKMWNSSNDGSGSGLDADLLDGQHASAFQPAANELTWVDQATGNYGTIKVDDDRGVTWAGYAIRDNWVFMADGATSCGIYNDTDNEWAIYCQRNNTVQLRYDGATKLATTGSGVQVTGSLEATVSAIIPAGFIGTYIYHTGDNDSYFGFPVDNYFRIVVGNTEAVNITSTIFTTNLPFTSSADITAFSDIRLKENVETIDNALDKVKSMRGVTYTKDGKAGLGVIAQEVEEVIPQVVRTADDEIGTKSVAYGNIVGLLIEAVKEQQQQIDALKNEVNALKGVE